MIINLDELNQKDEIKFKYVLKKDDELDSRILDLKDTVAEGVLFLNALDDIEFNCTIDGVMIIEDSVTLEAIPYEFHSLLFENISDINEFYDKPYDISKNTLDLKTILWQNIVLEVPMSYTLNEDAKLKGNGWEFKNNEKNDNEIDPRFELLSELLKGDD